MDLLILGGTLFLGRFVAEKALQRGYRVTLFHRGRTGADLFPHARRLLGDRFGDLSALEGRWDAVVDTSAWHPAAVAPVVSALARRVGHYTFVSSISAYAALAPGLTEDAPLHPWTGDWPPPTERQFYGEMKAECERVVRAGLGDRACVVRPGLLVGPHDPTDRFTYWVARLDRPGGILAPAEPSRQLQILDARDLASWLLDLAEDRDSGTYHAVGPREGLTMGALLAPAADRLAWVPEEWLLEQGVQPWTELPLWVPRGHGIMAVDPSRAWERGLATRPVAQTVADTLAWHRSRPPGPLQAGLPPEREVELLNRWRNPQGPG